MAAKITTAARLSALETQLATLVDALAAAQARTPVQAAPAKAKAESPFVVAMRERAAAKAACSIHPAASCNRRFSAKSSGATNHVARVI